MGILRSASKTPHGGELLHLPSGCFTLHRGGNLAASTLPSSFSHATIHEIGSMVLAAFRRAQESNLSLTDLNLHFSGLSISARDLRGGVLIFLTPATLQLTQPHHSPAMHYKNLDEFILHLENYIECWKLFNHYVNRARDKIFSREDETEFLEIKSLIMQGLEGILASVDKGAPKKEDVLTLFQNSSSLRHLADQPETAAQVESQWHRIYIGLQSLLGQLKVQQNKEEKPSGWNLFSKR